MKAKKLAMDERQSVRSSHKGSTASVSAANASTAATSSTTASRSQSTTAAYTPEEQVFHRLFPQVPLTEKLIEFCTCGIMRNNLLRMGKLYITALRMCFTSSFLRDTIVLQWEDVFSVDLRTNIMFDSITVRTKSQVEHVFSTFLAGGTSQIYKLMRTLWSVRERYAASEEASVGVRDRTHSRSSSSSSTASAAAAAASTTTSATATTSLRPSETASRGVTGDREGDESGAEADVTARHNTATTPEQKDELSAAESRAAVRTPSAAGEPAMNEAASLARHVSPRAEALAGASPIAVRSSSTANNAGVASRQPAVRATSEPPSLTSAAAAANAASSSPLGVSLSGARRESAARGGVVVPSEAALDAEAAKIAATNELHNLLLLDGERAVGGGGAPRAASAPRSPTVAALSGTTAFAAASKTSEPGEGTRELRQLFPALPEGEVISHTFTCNYVSGVHREGKMYISANYVLFVPYKLRQPLQIAWDDVERIEKEQTMMILDGIAIQLSSQHTMSFTSFVSRDTAYNVLMATKAKHEAALAAAATAAQSASSNSNGSPTTAAANVAAMSLKTQTCELDLGKMPPAETLDRLSTVETDYGSGLSDYALFTSELMPALGLPAGRTVMDVFAVAFDDDAAVLVDYHRDRGDVDQKWERWRATKDGDGFRGQRLFECTTVVKAMMGKRCPFTEYQRYAFLSVKGVPTLLVQFSSQISGVMYSDAFRTESLIVFSQSEVNGAAVVTMRMYGYVQFLKSVWIKGKINSTALSELQEGAKKLAAMLTSALAKTQGIAVSAAAAAATTTAAADASAGGAVAEVAEGVTPAAAAAAEAGGKEAASSVMYPRFVPYVRLVSDADSATRKVALLAVSLVCALTSLYGTCISYRVHSPDLHSLQPRDASLTLEVLALPLVQLTSSVLCACLLFVSVQLALNALTAMG